MNKDKIWEKLSNVWEAEAGSVKNLINIIEQDAILSVINTFCECSGKVITTGAGTSGAAAKKIAHTLSCIEIPSLFLSPADAVHGGLGVVQKNDIVVAISKGGETEEILKLIPAIKKKGTKLIGVTEDKNSKLAKESDIVLNVRVEKEPDLFNMLATSSTMAVIAVFDAIAVILMELTNFTKEKFAVIHTGGAVGKRLLKTERNEEQ